MKKNLSTYYLASIHFAPQNVKILLYVFFFTSGLLSLPLKLKNCLLETAYKIPILIRLMRKGKIVE